MKKLLFVLFAFLIGCQESPMDSGNQAQSDGIIAKISHTGTPQQLIYKSPEGISFKESTPYIRSAFNITGKVTQLIRHKNWEEATTIVESELAKIEGKEKYWVETVLSGHLLMNQLKTVQAPNEKYFQKLEWATENLIEAGSPSVELIAPALKKLESHRPINKVALLADHLIKNVEEADEKCTLTCSEKILETQKAQKQALVAEIKGIASRNNQ